MTHVDEALIADIISGEVGRWYGGVCSIIMGGEGDRLLVYGENGHLIEPVSIHVYRRDGPTEKRERDLTRIAEAVNNAIESEQSEL